MYVFVVGANVNASKMHQVPLHVAAHNNNVAMAALLLDHGAGIYARNNWGRTPLDLAIPMSDTAKLLVYWQSMFSIQVFNIRITFFTKPFSAR